jgi:hypothetical protein
MKKAGLLITAMFLTILACKQESKQTKKEDTSVLQPTSMLDSLGLKLNNGEKWNANLETQKGIERMDSIITTFRSSGNKDYRALGENLSKQTSYVIEKCTMKGESHDQLHLVLVPMLDEIAILKESEGTVTSQEALDRLQQLISGYFNYFKA